jgi:Cu2+-exporting ATPase
VLDKTGTITAGQPVVTDSRWLHDDDSAKAILYHIEKLSEHPLAEAIVEHLQAQPEASISQFESITGKGASAIVNEMKWYVGNRKLMMENGVFMADEFIAQAAAWSVDSKTVIWFANEKEALSIMAIADEIKATSFEAIEKMQKMGIEVHMLTGDHVSAAKAIAEKVGITQYKADVLPYQKAEYIKALQAEGKIVAMVGDGINDSTALAQADVSIAMGKGSDIAMDVAKMTIISSDLNKIPTAIALSKQTVRTIRENLFWAFIYNIIGIPIAAGVLYPFTGFLLNPMIAGAAMAFSSVSVVSNSLRLKWARLE